jgi:hypothetical protein
MRRGRWSSPSLDPFFVSLCTSTPAASLHTRGESQRWNAESASRYSASPRIHTTAGIASRRPIRVPARPEMNVWKQSNRSGRGSSRGDAAPGRAQVGERAPAGKARDRRAQHGEPVARLAPGRPQARRRA